MKVLLTGATGFVGKATLERLIQSHEVCALCRRLPPPEVVSEGRVNWRIGDVTDERSVETAVTGMDAVIHLVGIISETRRVAFERVHVGGTFNVVRAARGAGVKALIHMSALGTRPESVSRYHKTKWEAEQIVRSSGLAWTIFRPSLIYGPGDHFVNLFAGMAKSLPVLPVMGKGIAQFAPVHVRVVAEAFVSAITQHEAAGRSFDLCGSEIMTMLEIMRRILAAIRKRRVVMRVPMSLARPLARSLEVICGSILGVAPPLNRDQLRMLEEGSAGDGAPADELFKLKHPQFDAALRDYLPAG